jgi:hypothetical protein
MAEQSTTTLDVKGAEELEKKYDTALATRDNGPKIARFLYFVSIAFAGFFLAPLNALWRFLMVAAGILLVAPSWGSDLVALVIAAPVVASQVLARRNAERRTAVAPSHISQ